MSRRIAEFLWIALLVIGAWQVSRSLHWQDISLDDAKPALSQLPKDLTDALTAGHRNLYDDYLNIWTQQFFRKGAHSGMQLETVAKSIARQSPQIESVYLLSCTQLAFEYRRSDLCKVLSDAGIRAIPDSWKIPFTQGFVEYFLHRNLVSAQLYFGIASSRQGAPDYLPGFIEKIGSEPPPQGDLSVLNEQWQNFMTGQQWK